MSKGIEIELDSGGIRQYQKEETRDMLEQKAREIAGRADGEYQVSVHSGRNRANASIYTTDSKTYQDNLENNTLLKAVH